MDSRLHCLYMRFYTLPSAALLWCVSCAVAQKPATPNAFDKPTMEQYVRHLYVWGPQISVSVSDPKPSTDLPGFKEVVVTGNAGQASQEETFYISNDGKRIIRGAVYNIATNPFESDKAKLKTDLQPSFGEPRSPGSDRDVQRLPMQLLQGRSQDYPPECGVYISNTGARLLQGFSARADSSVGQAGRHRRTLCVSSEAGCLLGLSRLDFRASRRDLARKLEGEGRRMDKDEGNRADSIRGLYR